MPSFPSGNSANGINTVYSKKLNANFYKASVIPAIANTNWEGEIKDSGNKVVIRTRPDVAVKPYTGSITYDSLEPGKTELMIDQAEYYAFIGDDIQNAQSNINEVNEATQDAAENTKIAVDTNVLGSVYADIPVANQIAAPATGVQVTKTNVLDYIVDCGNLLDEANVPESGRWLILPPWVCAMIKKSELRDASVTGESNNPTLRNGQIGMIDRFTIYSSNCLATDGTSGAHMCMAGTKDFLSFASQFVKHRSMELEGTFGTGHSGLKVYGYKVTKADAGVLLPAMK
jgi:hypothetical protein